MAKFCQIWSHYYSTNPQPVWPDVEIKSSPIFPMFAQKESTEILNWKVPFFKIAPKVIKYLGYFLTKICSQDLSKIAQSGHTALNPNRISSFQDKYSADGCSRSSSVLRQISRKWTLPTDCNPNDVVSNLSSDGVLLITAPKRALTYESQKALKH